LSFISLIAIGGVVVGVSALTVVMAVMNGLQRDLREKILIGSPDLRLLTFGSELSMPDWRQTLEKVKKTDGCGCSCAVGAHEGDGAFRATNLLTLRSSRASSRRARASPK
jgi:lipoprotein-releasing system permease protein